jgi:hypothetical protein
MTYKPDHNRRYYVGQTFDRSTKEGLYAWATLCADYKALCVGRLFLKKVTERRTT